MTDLTDRFVDSFGAVAAIGRTPSGYRRFSWTEADEKARAWFVGRARTLGMETRSDGNGNLYAWWGDPDAPRVVLTGSHLDTVVDGGAFDGALGIVSGFLAVERLQAEHERPGLPIGVVAFVDEEGARFGVPTVGSRLLTGALAPEQILGLTDRDGVRWSTAMRAAGADPTKLGPDPGLLDRVAGFVELHVEQGRGLVYEVQPVGIISGIWPHGRWRVDLRGSSDHAGAARLEDRRDPALPLASAVLAARETAADLGARATVGRIEMAPNTTNVVPERAACWLDARAPDDHALDQLVDKWLDAIEREAELAGIAVALTRESYTAGVSFDPDLSTRLGSALESLDITPTELPTAAGHDAGALAARVPAAMLHVRNVTGVSHSPNEDAALEDCVVGVRVLAGVLEDLACR